MRGPYYFLTEPSCANGEDKKDKACPLKPFIVFEKDLFSEMPTLLLVVRGGGAHSEMLKRP